MPPSRSAKASRGRSLAEVLLRGDPAGFLGWNPGPLSMVDVLPAWRRALDRREDSGVPHTVQLYVHFAFCRMSCRFCQYWHSLTRDDQELDRYTDHLISLAVSHERALGRVQISNAYFGGGTPTALTTPMLERLQPVFRTAFDVEGEFTTEAHPTTLDEDKLTVLSRFGINRISMGLQSFDPAVLHHVGRSNGDTAHIQTIVGAAQRLGILVNVDLIAGLPAQTLPSLERDLDQTAALGPDTITLYRYQPVHRLPEAPPDSMRLGAVLPPTRLARMAMGGYLPFSPIGDERYSVLLVRAASRRVARFIYRNTIGAAASLLSGNAVVPRYTDVDRADVLMMGLGPGSVSHVHGLGWYRDVTALRAADGHTGAVYWGSRLSADDETRGAVLIDLARGDWVRSNKLAAAMGNSPTATKSGNGGVFQRFGGWTRIRPHAKADSRAEVLRELLPAPPPDDVSARELFARTVAFQMRKDVQPELVEVDRALHESRDQ